MLLSLTQEDNADVDSRAARPARFPWCCSTATVQRESTPCSLASTIDAGMTAAVRHLLDLGHRDFALVIGGPALPARDRRAAVEETLWPSGGRCKVVEGAFGVEGGYRATLQALDCTPAADRTDCGRQHVDGRRHSGDCTSSDIQIGTDISFVGCDNVLVAELHQPPIAVVYRDAGELGATGLECSYTCSAIPRTCRKQRRSCPPNSW